MTAMDDSIDRRPSDGDRVDQSVTSDRRGCGEFHGAGKFVGKIRRDVSPFTGLNIPLNYSAAQRDEHATHQRLRTLMPKLVKIGLILATAALLIAAKQFAPVHVPTTVAAAPSVSPGEMMRTTAPLTETPVDSFF